MRDPTVRRIAIVRLRVGLGDLLASVPALRALRAARPDAEVVMITWREVAPVVARMATYVDELMDFPGYPGVPERPPLTQRLPAFLADARRRSFDLALQMYGGQPSANEVTSLLGARLTGGFFTPGAWDADPRTHLPYPCRLHEIRRHLRLVEFLGVPPGCDRLEFPLWDQDREQAAALQRRHGLQPFSYVCVHPGSTAASRRWPPGRFAAVADALAASGLRIVVTGVAGEEAYTRGVVDGMRAPAVDLCGQTTLGGYAGLLAETALLLGNDSGPAQLAVAVGAPSVTVYLAGDPTRWAGFDRGRHRVLQAGVACQPCAYQHCPIDFRCGLRLSPGRVLRETQQVLAEASRDAATLRSW